MTRLSIIHKTAYKYNKRVTLSYNEARMTPLTDPQQVVLESSLKVSPSQAALSSYRDYWGTRVSAFDMQMPHEHLEVLSTTTVEVHRVERIPAEADIVGWDVLDAPETLNKFSDWIPQSQLTGPGAEVLGIIPGVVEGRNPHEAAMAVFEWMRGEMTYMKGSTGVTTSAEQAWNQRQGVCQDLSPGVIFGQRRHIMLQRIKARRCQNPSLAHAAAEHLAPAPGPVDQVQRPQQHRARRAPEPLGKANRDGIRDRCKIPLGAAQCRHPVEEACAIQMHCQPGCTRRRCCGGGFCQRDSPAIMGILQRQQPAHRHMAVVRLHRRTDLSRVQPATCPNR